ncbi:MAG: LEA type 2 family protein [Gemmatimonadota bacterium]|nr:MAG: LEA type 2 family protein [Gemmatimonadota bacterium]
MSRTTYRRRLRLPPVLALSVAVFVASCATLRHLHFERPTVDLEALELVDLDLSGGSLILQLDVYNPNDYEIRTTRVEAELELEDTHFGNAVLEENVSLVPASHTLVAIPAEFTWEGVGAGARALLGRGAVRYELETRLRIETSLGGRTVSLHNRGEVPIKALLP